jgi:small subunit ribosomal protein S27e
LQEEKKNVFKKSLVQSPSLYFMYVKYSGGQKITTAFSHVQTLLLCTGCSTVQCQLTRGEARLMEGCSFGRKQHY